MSDWFRPIANQYVPVLRSLQTSHLPLSSSPRTLCASGKKQRPKSHPKKRERKKRKKPMS